MVNAFSDEKRGVHMLVIDPRALEQMIQALTLYREETTRKILELRNELEKMPDANEWISDVQVEAHEKLVNAHATIEMAMQELEDVIQLVESDRARAN